MIDKIYELIKLLRKNNASSKQEKRWKS